MAFVGDAKPLSEAECLHWIEVTDANFERRGYGRIAFVDRATGELIGCGGVVHPEQQPEPEVKYAFRKDTWGNGFATEAITALIDYATHTLGIKWMVATIAPGNTPSQRVMSKVGFTITRERINDDGSSTQIWEIGRDDD